MAAGLQQQLKCIPDPGETTVSHFPAPPVALLEWEGRGEPPGYDRLEGPVLIETNL